MQQRIRPTATAEERRACLSGFLEAMRQTHRENLEKTKAKEVLTQPTPSPP